MSFGDALGADVVLPVTGETIYHLRQQIQRRDRQIEQLHRILKELSDTWNVYLEFDNIDAMDASIVRARAILRANSRSAGEQPSRPRS